MRIAIAHSDEAFIDLIEQICKEGGHIIYAFRDGSSIVASLRQETFDLVMLDFRLPQMTGPEILTWIQENLETPPRLIMIAGQRDRGCIVGTLCKGANDFILTSEPAPIISARIDAALEYDAASPAPKRYWAVDNAYQFDSKGMTVSFDSNLRKLTAKEFSLALLLFQNLNHPFSRDELFNRIWGRIPAMPSRTLDVHISHLRTKLNLSLGHRFHLQGIVGYGYRLVRMEEVYSQPPSVTGRPPPHS